MCIRTKLVGPFELRFGISFTNLRQLRLLSEDIIEVVSRLVCPWSPWAYSLQYAFHKIIRLNRIDLCVCFGGGGLCVCACLPIGGCDCGSPQPGGVVSSPLLIRVDVLFWEQRVPPPPFICGAL